MGEKHQTCRRRRHLRCFLSAGEGSGKEEKTVVSAQKRKDSLERDSSEPQEKKAFSMNIAKKPQTKSGMSMNIGIKKTESNSGEQKKVTSINLKGSTTKPGPIKMSLASQQKESLATVKTKCDKVASVFNDDSEDEEEMPPEAKMKMRNVGRDTPTAAGPNSFGKSYLGFCDRNKIIEREIQQKILEISEENTD